MRRFLIFPVTLPNADILPWSSSETTNVYQDKLCAPCLGTYGLPVFSLTAST
jgi:hypothetical protein